MSSLSEQSLIHVEILQDNGSTVDEDYLKNEVVRFLRNEEVVPTKAKVLSSSLPEALKKHCIHINFSSDLEDESLNLPINSVEFEFYVYQLVSCQPVVEELSNNEDGDSTSVPASTHWLLPSQEFDGIWDNLYYDTDVKSLLLKFVNTAMLFSDKGVNPNIITWNRVVLLHGPPGTGKTSLCKALAHKLSVRLSHRYQYGQLVEINSHSLFSKWFSESGKLVQQLFTKLQELVEDRSCLVVVLIDEVESLTRSRTSSNASTEPGDAVRVVNALLTQLDLIKRNPNVLILTTSNISETVDLAFVDRADIKQYIGLPSPQAIYQIYYSCIKELTKVGIISGDLCDLFTYHRLQILKQSPSEANTQHSHQLMRIAQESVGLSGRTLRKIPFLAHAQHIHSQHCDLENYLKALQLAVQKQKKDREDLGEGKGV